MGFDEAKGNVRKTLPSHFLREVTKGVLSWSCCLRNRVTASHYMAARLSKSSPVELTVIKVTLADETIVFHLMCKEKCFCQMSVTEPTSTAWCQRVHPKDVNAASLLEFHPLGAAMAVTPAMGPGLRDECSGFTGLHS